jgi:hypothetical protein
MGLSRRDISQCSTSRTNTFACSRASPIKAEHAWRRAVPSLHLCLALLTPYIPMAISWTQWRCVHSAKCGSTHAIRRNLIAISGSTFMVDHWQTLLLAACSCGSISLRTVRWSSALPKGRCASVPYHGILHLAGMVWTTWRSRPTACCSQQRLKK